ncbi:hypothetical protein ACSYAD_12140 [Acaryochloris marina NIES-2412]|uniref:hypothetical protein n=1 Tax=Acaryochloris marina TaxID=155978 RepID=UPI004057EA45
MHLKKNHRKIWLTALVVVGVNIIFAFIGVEIAASYYTGNPIRPKNSVIDLMGIMAATIGVTQVLYLTPLAWKACQARRQDLLIGLILGGVVTNGLNLVLFVIYAFR